MDSKSRRSRRRPEFRYIRSPGPREVCSEGAMRFSQHDVVSDYSVISSGPCPIFTYQAAKGSQRLLGSMLTPKHQPPWSRTRPPTVAPSRLLFVTCSLFKNRGTQS